MINTAEDFETATIDEMALSKEGKEIPESLVYNEYKRNYYKAV